MLQFYGYTVQDQYAFQDRRGVNRRCSREQFLIENAKNLLPVRIFEGWYYKPLPARVFSSLIFTGVVIHARFPVLYGNVISIAMDCHTAKNAVRNDGRAVGR